MFTCNELLITKDPLVPTLQLKSKFAGI